MLLSKRIPHCKAELIFWQRIRKAANDALPIPRTLFGSPSNMLYGFHYVYEIVETFNASDALCVVSAGIGWTKPVCAFLRAHAVAPNGGTVLLLGLTPSQKEALEKELQRQAPSVQYPIEINNAISTLERLVHYGSGPFCYVTTRILVVDLLTEKIPPDTFAGIFIVNAERALENSGVEFVIRLYRLGNRNGFVRAISDQPLSFTGGFNKAEKVMMALQVRTLSLWPRFQLTVKADLERTPIQVIEVTQALSPAMESIQDAIKELITALVEELKKTGKIDSSEMTIENCLFKNFDEMIRRQLDPIWNTVSWKMKQIVHDLRQLRELLLDLMTHDAVTFLSFLERIQMTGGDSIWQFHDASHTIFEQAKRRVYVIALDRNDKEAPKGKKRKQEETHSGRRPELLPVLEPLPKWDALRDVLSEIQQEVGSHPSQSTDKPKSVLVVCKEMFMKNQLKWAIQNPKKLLKELFHEYLASSRDLRESRAAKRRSAKQNDPVRCDFSLYVRGDLSESLARLSPRVTPVESVALNNSTEELTQNEALRKARIKNKRQSDDDEKQSNEEIEDTERESIEARKSTGSMLYSNEGWGGEECMSDLLKNVHFYPLDSKNESVLWDTQPDYVVMYHPDVAFVRQIEVFQAENPEKCIKLYLIYYDNSVEQSTFEAFVQRETDIFANLIEHKGRITIPLDVGETSDPVLRQDMVQQSPTVNARAAKVQQLMNERGRRYQIIVDMREFMSKLPAVLHRCGFKLFPVTLEIGDFVLTPDIVIERKTVSDLYSSMRSGRLFNQADAMSKKCNIPILLIEFDSDKQFRLQSDSDIGKEISAQSITSRLVLLVLHFPKLRLVWSPSSQVTCRIFDKLKRNRSEPEVEEVAQAQRRRHATAEVANEKAVDILKKLPGVTDTNSRKIMTSCLSLAGLAATSLERLEVIMGSKKNAKALHSFLHSPSPKT